MDSAGGANGPQQPESLREDYGGPLGGGEPALREDYGGTLPDFRTNPKARDVRDGARAVNVTSPTAVPRPVCSNEHEN